VAGDLTAATKRRRQNGRRPNGKRINDGRQNGGAPKRCGDQPTRTEMHHASGQFFPYPNRIELSLSARNRSFTKKSLGLPNRSNQNKTLFFIIRNTHAIF